MNLFHNLCWSARNTRDSKSLNSKNATHFDFEATWCFQYQVVNDFGGWRWSAQRQCKASRLCRTFAYHKLAGTFAAQHLQRDFTRHTDLKPWLVLQFGLFDDAQAAYSLLFDGKRKHFRTRIGCMVPTQQGKTQKKSEKSFLSTRPTPPLNGWTTSVVADFIYRCWSPAKNFASNRNRSNRDPFDCPIQRTSVICGTIHRIGWLSFRLHRSQHNRWWPLHWSPACHKCVPTMPTNSFGCWPKCHCRLSTADIHRSNAAGYSIAV